MRDSIFMKTLYGEKCERPPVWFMRQAGRVLPSYLKLRKKYSFRQLMQDPELTARVTLLPVEDLGVDAAILFSDILVIPEALGMLPDFTETGPVFHHPIRGKKEISDLVAEPSSLDHIYQAIEKIREMKPASIPLIGFCGGPFTTFCYMVQGSGQAKNHAFPDAIRFLYSERKAALELLEVITDMSVTYAVRQVKQGIDAFQLFETHAGLLPWELYLSTVMPFADKILNAVRELGCHTIFFPKGLGSGIRYLNQDTVNFIGVDWQDSLMAVRSQVDQNTGLQGNLDPRLLSVNNKEVLFSALEKFRDFGKKHDKWIFNTGHGLSPDNSFENVKAVVDWVKNTDWGR